MAEKPTYEELEKKVKALEREKIGRKQAEKALKESENLLCTAQKYANAGSWSWNFKTGIALWSEQLYKIYGRDIELGVPSMENFLEIYHPDDRKPLQKVIDRAIKENKPYNIDYRIFRYNDGEERWIRAEGKLEKNEKGIPSRLIGMAQDITDAVEDLGLPPGLEQSLSSTLQVSQA